MLSCCLQCKKKYLILRLNTKVTETKNGRAVILSQYDVCGSKKSRFITKQEANGLVSNLGIRKSLSKIPLLVDILF